MIIVISYSINDVTWHLSEAFGYFHKPVPPYIWEHCGTNRMLVEPPTSLLQQVQLIC